MTATGAQAWTRTYTYDELNRIKTMSATGVACTGLAWTYDAWGNRLTQGTTGGTCGNSNPTINTQNRIVDAGYSYDAAGNLTAEPGKTYQWDAESRMVSINNGSTASYKYDASGRRVEKNAGGVRTQYVYGAGGVVAEWVNGAQPMQGTWTVGYITFNGQMVAQYSAGTTFFAHKDHLGSLRVMTKLDKTVQDNMDYLPFGEQVAGSSSSTHKFTGHERDGESGLDYMGARYYTSLAGRFMSADSPFIDQHRTNPQTWNLYSYVRNNPLAFADLTGNAAEAQFCSLAQCAPYESNGGPNTIGISGMYGATSIDALAFDLFSVLSSASPADPAQEKRKTSPQESSDPAAVLRNLPLKRFGDLATNDTVLYEMFLLWEKSGYGRVPTERSMWIVMKGDTITFIPWPWSAEAGRETWKGPIPKGAIAIAHTHPDNRSPKPSGDNGDQGTSNKSRLPVYVVTRHAIWKAIPRAKDPVQVAYDSWWARFERERKEQN